MLYLDKPLAFIDLETTGSFFQKDDIIEIAIILIKNTKIQKFQKLFKPRISIPKFIENLTGITNNKVEKEANITEYLPTIYELLNNTVLIAHNANFDHGFLEEIMKNSGYKLNVDVLCTLKLAKLLFPQEKKLGLDFLIEKYDLSIIDRHRAMGDTEALFQFWGKISEEFPEKILKNYIRSIMTSPIFPAHLKQYKVQNFPKKSGVYLFENENNCPIYIGKTRNLQKKIDHHFKTCDQLFHHTNQFDSIKNIKIIQTKNEIDTLLIYLKYLSDHQPDLNLSTIKNEFLYSWQIQLYNQNKIIPQLIHINYDSLKINDHLVGLFQRPKEAILFLQSTLKKLIDFDYKEKYLFSEQTTIIELSEFNNLLINFFNSLNNIEIIQHYNECFTQLTSNKIIKKWPFPHKAYLKQQGIYHIFDQWHYLGYQQNKKEILFTINKEKPFYFNKEIYRMLNKKIDQLQENLN